MPHLATCIILFFYNEPQLGVGIDPGMVLTPLPSSIGRGSNLQHSDCEPSDRSTASPQLLLVNLTFTILGFLTFIFNSVWNIARGNLHKQNFG